MFVLDRLEADREPLSYEECIQLQAEPIFDEETEHVVFKQLTSNKFSFLVFQTRNKHLP